MPYFLRYSLQNLLASGFFWFQEIDKAWEPNPCGVPALPDINVGGLLPSCSCTHALARARLCAIILYTEKWHAVSAAVSMACIGIERRLCGRVFAGSECAAKSDLTGSFSPLLSTARVQASHVH